MRSCLPYKFKLGTKTTEAAHRICTEIGECEVSGCIAQKLFRRLSVGNESLIDAPHKGQSV